MTNLQIYHVKSIKWKTPKPEGHRVGIPWHRMLVIEFEDGSKPLTINCYAYKHTTLAGDAP